MFTDVAQEIQKADRGGPIGVVHQSGGVTRTGKVEQRGELTFDALNILDELLPC